LKRLIPEAVFLLPKSKNGGLHMAGSIKRHITKGYWSLIAMCIALILALQPIMAESIFDRFSSIMADVYGQIVGISTIVGVTAASVALLVRMISRNQRAVDEATSWLKRIIVTWIILNTLGFAVAYLQPLIAGGNFTG